MVYSTKSLVNATCELEKPQQRKWKAEIIIIIVIIIITIIIIIIIILLHEKFLQFDWLRAVVLQLNLKYLVV